MDLEQLPLTRVCIYALGRAPKGSLRPLLRPLCRVISRWQAALRKCGRSRTHRCFFYLPKGRWQLGKPARLRQPLLAIPVK
jgi:hypothetical protein